MDLYEMEKALMQGCIITYTDFNDFKKCTAEYIGGDIVLVKRAYPFRKEEEYHHIEALLYDIQDFQVAIIK